jgi:transcriptional regulator with AAA-type ATPase domain
VERLIELAGGVTDAARAMGKTGKKLAGGKSLISQWRNGTKAPSDKSLQKIREVIDRLEAEGPRKHKRRPGQRARISREEFDAALARARTRKSKRQTLAAALARELGSSYRTARSTAEGFGVDLGKKRARLTRTKVEDALMKSAGDMHEAARSLGVTWHALQRRMVEWGMKDPAPEVVKVTDEEVLDAMARHGSHRGKAAADLGIPYRRMLDRLHRIGVRRELKATKKQIKAALKKHCGDRGKAAREVGLSYQYFVKRLRDLGFRRPGQWGRKKCWPPSKEELVTLLHEYRGDRGAVADVLWENVKNVYQLQREYMITSDRIRAANEYGWIYIPSPANYITGAASESMADIEALVSLGAFGEDPAEGAKVTIHGRGGRRMSRDEREGAYKDPAYLWLRERGEHEGWALPTQENPAPPRRFRRRRLNPDVDARRAMRSYAAGGSVQQAASALASRLRSGELQRGHLEALSCMGDQAAEFVVGPCLGGWADLCPDRGHGHGRGTSSDPEAAGVWSCGVRGWRGQAVAPRGPPRVLHGRLH